jgi:hypothetical protein
LNSTLFLKLRSKAAEKKQSTETLYFFTEIVLVICEKKKGKVIPLHAMEAHGGRGCIAPAHS